MELGKYEFIEKAQAIIEKGKTEKNKLDLIMLAILNRKKLPNEDRAKAIEKIKNLVEKIWIKLNTDEYLVKLWDLIKNNT